MPRRNQVVFCEPTEYRFTGKRESFESFGFYEVSIVLPNVVFADSTTLIFERQISFNFLAMETGIQHVCGTGLWAINEARLTESKLLFDT